MSLPPPHIPLDGGSPVFLVGDTYTTLLSAEDTGGEGHAGPGRAAMRPTARPAPHGGPSVRRAVVPPWAGDDAGRALLPAPRCGTATTGVTSGGRTASSSVGTNVTAHPTVTTTT
ncbi:hypothetical protein SAMN05216505_10593 [Streptomyces prasinopilosus]|uniref:Uncharacterized protein n=1 Tax=Streptomyces prasinopilosus TaxID=67344 RepID=A0A1G6S1Q0_9ACTN|nr:hypothetical protein SAMN05216505_10593 [Streptomyces prasinopilosus]